MSEQEKLIGLRSNESGNETEDVKPEEVTEVLRKSDIQYLLSIEDAIKYSSLPMDQKLNSIDEVEKLAEEKLEINLSDCESIYYPEQYKVEVGEKDEYEVIDEMNVKSEIFDEIHSLWSGKLLISCLKLYSINYSDGKLTIEKKTEGIAGVKLTPKKEIIHKEDNLYIYVDGKEKFTIESNAISYQKMNFLEDESIITIAKDGGRSQIHIHRFLGNNNWAKTPFIIQDQPRSSGFSCLQPISKDRFLTSYSSTLVDLKLKPYSINKKEYKVENGEISDIRLLKDGRVALLLDYGIQLMKETSNGWEEDKFLQADGNTIDLKGMQIINETEFIVYSTEEVYHLTDSNKSKLLYSVDENDSVLTHIELAHFLPNGNLIVDKQFISSDKTDQANIQMLKRVNKE